MDYRSAISVLGRLILGYGFCILIPGLFSLYSGELAWKGLIISSFLSIMLGTVMITAKHEHGHIGIREGFAIVGGGWLLSSFLGALPYTLSGVLPNYVDAIFETVSGLTTTGASVIAASNLEAWDAMGAVAATLGNVGPGYGVVGPTSNYGFLSDFVKIVLSLCMLLGRLELFTLLVFLRPEFWRSHRNW